MKHVVQKGVLKPAEHGRYIYAYCHARTNQVVYSLTRLLHKHDALKQLPDLGANNKDASIRKDLWKPLWTVSLPPGPDGLKQGLDAFKKLREYRKLHETNWEPPALLSKPFAQKDIEKLQDELDNRGGSKKETVYDIIKRKKKKMRIKMVQDQKANSIADLAAVLSEQEDVGVQTSEQKTVDANAVRKGEIAMMLDLAAQAAAGGIPKLEQEIKDWQQRLSNIDEAKAAGVQSEDDMSRTQIQRQLHYARIGLSRMRFSSDAVMTAQEQHAKEQAAREQTRQDKGTDKNTEVQAGDVASDEVPIDWDAVLPTSTPRDPSTLPKRGAARQRYDRQNAPVFSTEGVTVKWENLLDAEHAEAWPENVRHMRMGWTRYTAPHGSVVPDGKLDSTRELIANQRNTSPMERLKQNGERAKVSQRKQFLESAKSEILRLVQEKEIARQEKKGKRSGQKRKDREELAVL